MLEPGGRNEDARRESGLKANSDAGYSRNENDRCHLVGILPDVDWLLVMEEMRDEHSYLVNICNASTHFRNLLLSERVLFLFTTVWQILGIKYEEEHEFNPVYNEAVKRKTNDGKFETTDGAVNDGEDEGYNYEDDDDGESVSSSSTDSFEEDDETCWFRGILTIRLVCRTWKVGVDNFYQNLPQHYRMEALEVVPEEERRPDFLDWSDGEDGVMIHWTTLGFSGFEDPDRLTEFLEHFEETHYSGNVEAPSNPFITRKIIFEYCHQSGNQFIYQLGSLLRKYGRHIWYCIILAHDDYPSRAAYYAQLKQFLEMMPNLKVLEIMYTREGETSWRDIFIDISADYSEEETSQMQHETAINPLPRFESLQCLKITYLPAIIFNELIRRNSHISVLDLHGDSADVHYDIDTIDLPYLEQLSVKHFS